MNLPLCIAQKNEIFFIQLQLLFIHIFCLKLGIKFCKFAELADFHLHMARINVIFFIRVQLIFYILFNLVGNFIFAIQKEYFICSYNYSIWTAVFGTSPKRVCILSKYTSYISVLLEDNFFHSDHRILQSKIYFLQANTILRTQTRRYLDKLIISYHFTLSDRRQNEGIYRLSFMRKC